MTIDTKKIAPSTIVRTLVLLTGLINLALTMSGKNPLPFKDQDISEFVAYFWTGASAIWSWWKNNSFTTAAIHADEVKKIIKAQEIIPEAFNPVVSPVQYFDSMDDDTDYNEDEDPEEEEFLPVEDYDPEEDGDEETEE